MEKLYDRIERLKEAINNLEKDIECINLKIYEVRLSSIHFNLKKAQIRELIRDRRNKLAKIDELDIAKKKNIFFFFGELGEMLGVNYSRDVDGDNRNNYKERGDVNRLMFSFLKSLLKKKNSKYLEFIYFLYLKNINNIPLSESEKKHISIFESLHFEIILLDKIRNIDNDFEDPKLLVEYIFNEYKDMLSDEYE